MFSFGGQESDASGQNVLIDSKETREALRFAEALFDEGMTPEVFSWDDASDNRYLASGVASWIHDAISAYRTTEDTNPKVFQNTYIALEPQGAGGKRVSVANPNVYLIWKFAKNPQAAKEFLEYLSDNWKDGMIASRGYNMPFLKEGYKKPAQLGEQHDGVMLADPLRDTVVLRILFTEDRWLSFLLAPDAHDLHRWAWTAGWAYRRERVTASATIRRRRWSSTGLTR